MKETEWRRRVRFVQDYRLPSEFEDVLVAVGRIAPLAQLQRRREESQQDYMERCHRARAAVADRVVSPNMPDLGAPLDSFVRRVRTGKKQQQMRIGPSLLSHIASSIPNLTRLLAPSQGLSAARTKVPSR